MEKTMFKELIQMFSKTPAKTLAQEEYEEAQRQLLKHESAAAYHAKVAEYYSSSIHRLGAYIKKA